MYYRNTCNPGERELQEHMYYTVNLERESYRNTCTTVNLERATGTHVLQ